jgi:hypothetical protein
MSRPAAINSWPASRSIAANQRPDASCGLQAHVVVTVGQGRKALHMRLNRGVLGCKKSFAVEGG